ncbi:hypothetical protein CBL_02043 [Carabus blaptoides fortunei]
MNTFAVAVFCVAVATASAGLIGHDAHLGYGLLAHDASLAVAIFCVAVATVSAGLIGHDAHLGYGLLAHDAHLDIIFTRVSGFQHLPTMVSSKTMSVQTVSSEESTVTKTDKSSTMSSKEGTVTKSDKSSTMSSKEGTPGLPSVVSMNSMAKKTVTGVNSAVLIIQNISTMSPGWSSNKTMPGLPSMVSMNSMAKKTVTGVNSAVLIIQNISTMSPGWSRQQNHGELQPGLPSVVSMNSMAKKTVTGVNSAVLIIQNISTMSPGWSSNKTMVAFVLCFAVAAGNPIGYDYAEHDPGDMVLMCWVMSTALFTPVTVFLAMEFMDTTDGKLG